MIEIHEILVNKDKNKPSDNNIEQKIQKSATNIDETIVVATKNNPTNIIMNKKIIKMKISSV